VTTRLALSLFGSASAAELATAAESALEASRQAVLGSEAAAAGAVLDTVLLHWLDYEVRNQAYWHWQGNVSLPRSVLS
jgi:hypothetical protein